MSSILDTIADGIAGYVRTTWPDAANHAPVRFRACAERMHGDMSCDVAIRISEKLAIPADEIAALLAQACANSSAISHVARVSAQRGYLNFEFNYPAAQLSAVSSLRQHEHVSCNAIVVLKRPAWLPVTGYVRLVSTAFIQAVMADASITGCADAATARTKLIVAGRVCAIPLALSCENVAASLRELISFAGAPLALEPHWSAGLEEYLQESNLRLRAPTILCAPDTLPAKEFAALCRQFSVDGSRVDRLRVPKRRWLRVEWPTATWQRAIDQFTDRELLDFAVYCASPLHGSEIDLSVPRHLERMNLRRWCRATCDRIVRLLSAPQATLPGPIAGVHAEDLRFIWARSSLLRLLQQQGSQDGEITELWHALDELLEVTNRVMNSPALRLSLTRGTLDPPTHEILYGVGQWLSYSIKEKLFCCAV